MSLIQDCMKERLFAELVQSFVGEYDNKAIQVRQNLEPWS